MLHFAKKGNLGIFEKYSVRVIGISLGIYVRDQVITFSMTMSDTDFIIKVDVRVII